MKQSEGPLQVLTEAPPPQVFYPKDSYSHPLQLDLLFRQVRASLPFLPQCTQQGNGHVDWLSVDSAAALRVGLLDCGVDGTLFYCTPVPMVRVTSPQAHLTRLGV